MKVYLSFIFWEIDMRVTYWYLIYSWEAISSDMYSRSWREEEQHKCSEDDHPLQKEYLSQMTRYARPPLLPFSRS